MKQYPTISLFIPTFDRAHYLDQALQSVAKQTLKPYEVFVLDNASTDNTKEVVNKYKKYGIKYICNKNNIGPIRNWIKGFTLAQGEYVSMLPSDDMIAPNWCEEWTKLVKKHHHAFYTTPSIIIDEYNHPTYRAPLFSSSRLIKQPNVVREFWFRYMPGILTGAINLYHTNTFRNGPPYMIKEGFATDMRASAEILLKHDVYYFRKYLYANRIHSEQTFEKKKKVKSVDADLAVTRIHFQIIKDIYQKKLSGNRTLRYFIQIPVLHYLAAASLSVLKGNSKMVVKTYKLTFNIFPDLLKYPDDWIIFIKAYWYLFNRAFFTERQLPVALQKEFAWLKDIKPLTNSDE